MMIIAHMDLGYKLILTLVLIIVAIVTTFRPFYPPAYIMCPLL